MSLYVGTRGGKRKLFWLEFHSTREEDSIHVFILLLFSCFMLLFFMYVEYCDAMNYFSILQYNYDKSKAHNFYYHYIFNLFTK